MDIVTKNAAKTISITEKVGGVVQKFYWNKHIVLYLGFILSFIGLMYKIKIPIICAGCDERTAFSKAFFKCAVEGGKDSELCKFTLFLKGDFEELLKLFEVSTEGALDGIKSILALLKDVPKKILDQLEAIFIKLLKFKDTIMTTLDNVFAEVVSQFQSILNKVKGLGLKTLDDVRKQIIEPVVTLLVNKITKPIIELLTLLVSFRKTLIETAKKNIQKVVDKLEIPLPKEADPFVIIDTIIQTIPKSFEGILNGIIKGLNESIKGLIKTTNTIVIDNMNIATENILNGIEKPANFVLEDVSGLLIPELSFSIDVPDPMAGFKAIAEGVMIAGKEIGGAATAAADGVADGAIAVYDFGGDAIGALADIGGAIGDFVGNLGDIGKGKYRRSTRMNYATKHAAEALGISIDKASEYFLKEALTDKESITIYYGKNFIGMGGNPDKYGRYLKKWGGWKWWANRRDSIGKYTYRPGRNMVNPKTGDETPENAWNLYDDDNPYLAVAEWTYPGERKNGRKLYLKWPYWDDYFEKSLKVTDGSIEQRIINHPKRRDFNPDNRHISLRLSSFVIPQGLYCEFLLRGKNSNSQWQWMKMKGPAVIKDDADFVHRFINYKDGQNTYGGNDSRVIFSVSVSKDLTVKPKYNKRTIESYMKSKQMYLFSDSNFWGKENKVSDSYTHRANVPKKLFDVEWNEGQVNSLIIPANGFATIRVKPIDRTTGVNVRYLGTREKLIKGPVSIPDITNYMNFKENRSKENSFRWVIESVKCEILSLVSETEFKKLYNETGVNGIMVFDKYGFNGKKTLYKATDSYTNINHKGQIKSYIIGVDARIEKYYDTEEGSLTNIGKPVVEDKYFSIYGISKKKTETFKSGIDKPNQVETFMTTVKLTLFPEIPLIPKFGNGPIELSDSLQISKLPVKDYIPTPNYNSIPGFLEMKEFNSKNLATKAFDEATNTIKTAYNEVRDPITNTIDLVYNTLYAFQTTMTRLLIVGIDWEKIYELTKQPFVDIGIHLWNNKLEYISIFKQIQLLHPGKYIIKALITFGKSVFKTLLNMMRKLKEYYIVIAKLIYEMAEFAAKHVVLTSRLSLLKFTDWIIPDISGFGLLDIRPSKSMKFGIFLMLFTIFFSYGHILVFNEFGKIFKSTIVGNTKRLN